MRKSFWSSSKTSSKRGLDVALSTLIALALAFVASACGGSGNGDGGDDPPPGGTNPCSVSLEESATAPTPAADVARKQQVVDGNPRWRLLDALWLHQSRQGRIPRPQALTTGRNDADVGEIAVVQDEGDLIESPNNYDLRNLGLRFTRNGAGGYDVRRIEGNFRTTIGSRLTLTDDDSRQLNVAFGFSFYGQSHTTAFVNSDGNITFEEEEHASTDRNVARLLTGPPRVAPFFADLDPSTAGGVFGVAASDHYTVTWCGVRGFESTRTVNAQVTLLPDGSIEMKYGEVSLPTAVVALSPGRTGAFTTVNLSDNGPSGGGAGAVGERFSDRLQLDFVELIRKFYRTHPDDYDQLVIWTDVTLIENAFAFESTIANQIRGIGLDVFDSSRDFGSPNGRLQSYAMMDAITKYPDDPQQTFLGENNTVSLMGQEVGHRWLAFLEFRNAQGVRSGSLLGRDESHWSFFFDSDGSVMEGNDIEDLGGGSFRTVGAVRRYSRLDQYAMGLVPDSQVPSFFYVDNPTNVAGGRRPDSAPAVGVTFNGTRRDVLINDVIAIHGPRQPSAAESPRTHRQAFVFVVGAGRSPDSSQIAKIDRIRRAWESFFFEATERRMQAITTLR